MKRSHARLLVSIVAGWFVSQMIAYGCWWRIGHAQFNTDSDYWLVKHQTNTGFLWEGKRLGCTAWIGTESLSEPDVISNDTLNARIHHVFYSGARYGWPFRCVGTSNRSEQTNTKTNGKWATGQVQVTTPEPNWYHDGIPTGLSNGYLSTLPIEVLPLGMIGNSLLFGALIFGSALLAHAVFLEHRRRRGICAECKYPLKDLKQCPECGNHVDSQPPPSPPLQESEPPDVQYQVNQPGSSEVTLVNDDYFACFCFDGSMKKAADRVQAILGLDAPELRHGLNIGGGEYYMFNLDDRALYLVDNRNDEVGMDTTIDADYYLFSRLLLEHPTTVARIQHIALKIEAAGLKVELQPS